MMLDHVCRILEEDRSSAGNSTASTFAFVQFSFVISATKLDSGI